ncbi:thioredoxin domain-containing protein [Streptomyces sp. OF3]|uniref:Thioredoxin domain-containing protein n=1 Tax=Streptomyces alkaliterrae TaxID=2213162 RepID=A0A7W3ZN88_9ACTN|nr:thioredoxin domain-containing protein [Streptomyces alkaliterrae]MBB1254321.1 thioredoxin domain-containing protein [Streptomyces alkaliterrae]
MNRLAGATSPYLLQHADNPVDWWPWEPEAFEEARRRDVPVLLSVGYSACHWCHVMAHESFEDEATAAVMNAGFVSVKVDREERPDVDAVYMEAVQAATGQGGWPMTVFLTPDGEPFYFGTYFPPEPRHGMPSFRQVLEGVAAAWRERRGEVDEAAGRIVAELAGRRIDLGAKAPGVPGADDLGAALLGLTREFDAVNGGFGGAPKFPPALVLEFLLRHHARTGSEGALQMVRATCEAMARGGMYDQLGGGFARYSVDAEWRVPHFEKMLFDNALLCRVYAHLWRATGSEFARRVALETADFLVRELGTNQGGFASALDADSAVPGVEEGPHREGAFYVWTPDELREVLGEEDAALAADYFGVTAEGTFEEGASVLQLPDRDPADAEAEGEAGSGLVDAGRVDSIRERLSVARELRPRPGRDEKVVAAWNGLAVAALAEAGAYFERPDLVDAATAAADLLVGVHLDDRGRIARTSRDGVAGQSAGVLEDYASTAEGFLTLFAVTGDAAWLDLAGVLLDAVLKHFVAPDGALYDTADDAERLIRRPQDPTDNATPSGWTSAAGALLTYAAYTGSSRHRTAAERALGVVGALGRRAPRFIGWGLAVAEAALDGPREVAVVGPEGDADRAALHRAALLSDAPGAAVAVGEPTAGEVAGEPAAGEAGRGGGVALLADRPLVDGRSAAYVCRHFACAAPTTDPAVLAASLRSGEGRG